LPWWSQASRKQPPSEIALSGVTVIAASTTVLQNCTQ
jgi:hypothetical protein